MPVSKKPPLIACAIGSRTYSRKLIQHTREFVVNVPLKSLKQEIYHCGYHSGHRVDKFKETGLTPQRARRVKAPIIDQRVAHMECRLRRAIQTGDKIMFIGEVVDAYANEAIVTGAQKIEYAQGDFPRKVYTTRFK